MSPHLVADISGHGLGHLSLSAPVLNALFERRPGLRVTVRSALSHEVLARRIRGDFEHLAVAHDFGMVMTSALDVNVAESLRAYREVHADWYVRVARAADELAALKPDLLFANVPYLTLAGAARAGIPAVALCPLNWADIYAGYADAAPEAAAVRAAMVEAYNSACAFMIPAPGMPMPDIERPVLLDPIADRGRDRRAEIERRFGLQGHERLVLVAMGGIAMRLPMEGWPRRSGVRWIVQRDWRVDHPDALVLEALDMPFVDVLASCDALLTKPGYGSFSEAACNGVPALWVARADWPEAPYLVEWLKRNAACLEVGRAQLMAGDLAAKLGELLRQPRPSPPEPRGAAQAAAMIDQLLS